MGFIVEGGEIVLRIDSPGGSADVWPLTVVGVKPSSKGVPGGEVLAPGSLDQHPFRWPPLRFMLGPIEVV